MRSINFNILIFSFFIIFIKWFFSFYYFNEPLNLKIIFESVTDGKYYYPLIKYLSDFNLSQSFDPEISNLKNIPLPFGGILIHAILFKLINFWSFILIEFICLFAFIYIFTNIFKYIHFKNNYFPVCLAILIFFSPIIIKNTFLIDFQFIKIFSDNIFNFRVPRPMVSNLYLFSFVLIIFKMIHKEFFKLRYFILLGVLAGLSLSSFFYHFIIEFIFFISIFIFRFKKNIFQKLKEKINLFLIGSLFFLFTISPFILNLYYHESEFTIRQCVFNLSVENKIELIKFFLKKYFSIKFLTTILIISSINFLINKKFKEEKNISNIFYLFFISTILAPIFFIIFSSKSCVLYHFVNLIILSGLTYLLIILSISIKKIKFKNQYRSFLLVISIFFILFSYSEIKKNKTLISNTEYKQFRNEFKLITHKIKNEFDIQNISLLTFETDLMIWLIMNDIKYLDLINALFTSKKDYMIEDDLISSFKKLKLTEKEFNDFISNKKESWRYMNKDMAKFFFYKYQANSLVTFNSSKSFKTDEYNFIKKSSPLLHQQMILPIEEIQRLTNKFNEFDKKIIFPNIIILNKNDDFIDYSNLEIINYCNKFDGNIFLLYVKKGEKLC